MYNMYCAIFPFLFQEKTLKLKEYMALKIGLLYYNRSNKNKCIIFKINKNLAKYFGEQEKS